MFDYARTFHGIKFQLIIQIKPCTQRNFSRNNLTWFFGRMRRLHMNVHFLDVYYDGGFII